MATVKQMKATARPKAGKGAARAERRAGRVPGVIYGDNKAPLTISLEHDELKERIYAGHFLTTIYELDVGGTTHRVIPRDFQLDAVKDMAQLAREENEALKVRVAALEAKLGQGNPPRSPGQPAPGQPSWTG